MTDQHPPATETKKILDFLRAVDKPDVLAKIIGGPEATAHKLLEAAASAPGSIDTLLSVPGVTMEAILRLHTVASRVGALGAFIGPFPIDFGAILKAAMDKWVKENCTLTVQQTAWECVGGRVALMDTDTYRCPDGSTHTVRTVRQQTDQKC